MDIWKLTKSRLINQTEAELEVLEEELEKRTSRWLYRRAFCKRIDARYDELRSRIFNRKKFINIIKHTPSKYRIGA